MTIALVLKVNDGIVLAADSASSMLVSGPNGSGVANVYNNANKIFNLHKGLPIGAMTWGLGNVGASSISTVSKDIRALLTDEIDVKSYTLEDTAARIHEELVVARYDVSYPPPDPRPLLGFLTAGYSSSGDARLFLVEAGDGAVGVPVELLPGNDGGAAWWGAPEAIARILNGFSNDTAQAIVNMGVGTPGEAVQFVEELQRQVSAPLIHPAMPIQDAIDLAEFLVHSTIQFVRFQPGAPTVGGPIEIAAITKHEGFKWVARKHYYDQSLNPGRQ